MTEMRVLVTGGSGFIGTNLVGEFLDKGIQVHSLDIRRPQNRQHSEIYSRADILHKEELTAVFGKYQPTHVVHLAARTDLLGRTIQDYSANTDGVRNVIAALGGCNSIRSCIFASTKLVTRSAHDRPGREESLPSALYSQSKVIGEDLVHSSEGLKCSWSIVRPTSIYGPWFGTPYRNFFLSIARGRYFHPGKHDPLKSFGFVGNVVHQLCSMVESPANEVHGKTFYLSDYQHTTIREWAEQISKELGRPSPRELPESAVRCAALAGDVLSLIGFKNPPLTSFRLANMRADTSAVELGPIMNLTGALPYNMAEGVKQTVDWLRQSGLVQSPASAINTGRLP